MNTVLKKGFFLLIYCFTTSVGLAGSILGGEITYQNLTADSVIVRMVLYRDCSQTQLDSIQKIVFTTTGCATNKNDTAFIKRRTISSADLLCGSVTSVCDGGSFSPGIQAHEYIDTFNLQQVFSGGLAAACCNLRISYTHSSRTYTTNIAAGYPFYIETTLNRCVLNKSVIFFNKPFFTMRSSAGKFQYTNGIIEQEGDSVVYELTQPMYDANNKISYINGFRVDLTILFNFLGFPDLNLPCPAGMHYNEALDNFDFTPMGGQNPTVNYRINEWRNVNGTMIKVSSVIRDFTFFTNSYPPNLFPAFGLTRMFTAPWCYVPFPPDPECNSNSEKYFYVTVGQRICFHVIAADTAAGDTTTITWNNGLPGASFASANQNGSVLKSDTAFICWTPTINQYRQEPYFFALTLTDKACPIRNRISRNQLVTVGPAYFPRSIISNGNGNYTIRMDYLSEVTNPSISWKLSLNRYGVFDTSNSVNYTGNPVNHHFTQNGKYVVCSTIQSGLTGVATFYDTIVACDFSTVAFAGNDTSLCLNKAVKMAGSPAGGLWSGAVLQNDTFYGTAPGNYVFVYSIGADTFGCAPLLKSDTMHMTIHPAPTLQVNPDTVLCHALKWVPLHAAPSGGGWRSLTGIPMNGNLFSANQPPGKYPVLYTVSDNNSCTATDTFSVDILYGMASFSPSATSGKAPLQVTFINTSDTLFDQWLWNFGNGPIDTSSLKQPNYTFLMQNRLYTVTLIAYNSVYGCTDTAYGGVFVLASSVYSPVQLFSVYPNPAFQVVYIDMGKWDGVKKIILTDISGKKVLETETERAITQLAIGHLLRGIYLLTVSLATGEQHIQKLVVE